MWVANRFNGRVQQIDPTQGTVVATVDTPLSLVWDGNSMWVAYSNNKKLHQINAKSLNFVMIAKRKALPK